MHVNNERIDFLAPILHVVFGTVTQTSYFETMTKKRLNPSDKALTPHLIKKGDVPPCLKKGSQCRGCFGWQNMIHAAESNPVWRNYPLCCEITGLTLKF